MVLFLLLNVSNYACQMAPGIGKGTISLLAAC